MKYDADYFIKKFEAIPANKWCKGAYNNLLGQHCALGHCGVHCLPGRILPVRVGEGLALNDLFREYIRIDEHSVGVTEVNDGSVQAKLLFPNKTIKGRILAALRVIKLMQAAGLPPDGE